MQYNVHEAKTHLSRLLDQAQRGEDVLVVRKGQAVRLQPVAFSRSRVLGMHRGEAPVPDESVFAAMSDEEAAEWFGKSD